jgi:hypothetical protein
MNAIFPIVFTVAMLILGIGFSWLLTAGLVRLMSTTIDNKDKIRVAAMGRIDSLLTKATSSGLEGAEKGQLQSAVMSYIMTATSRRTAEKYVNRLREAATTIGPELVTETESIFHDRFPSE